MKNIISLILIIASVLIFFGFIKPQYVLVTEKRKELQTYSDTLKQAGELEQTIKSLQARVKQLDPEDISKLNKVLPSRFSDIDLIININTIATSAGFNIKNISIAKPESRGETDTGFTSSPLYNSIDFSFSVSSTYSGFIAFLEKLEKSIPLVDVTKVTFSPSEKNVYDFSVTLRTYWLK